MYRKDETPKEAFEHLIIEVVKRTLSCTWNRSSYKKKERRDIDDYLEDNLETEEFE